METVADLWHLFVRLVRANVRMPVFVIISIVQPVLWVLLFGQLFRSVAALPGFGAGSYVQFLAPGIAIMTALFGAAYSGMGMLADIDRGVLDRLLATPVARGALLAARILYSAVQVAVQSAIFPAGTLGARHAMQKIRPGPQDCLAFCRRSCRNRDSSRPRIKIGRRSSMVGSPCLSQLRTVFLCKPNRRAISSTE